MNDLSHASGLARRVWLALGGLCALVGASARASAQGSVAAQGFGYPPGQLSTRALATGGALGMFDPQTSINPASLWSWGPAALHFNYAPEFRRVKVSGTGSLPQTTTGGSDRTTTIRFPLVAAAINMGQRTVVGISASTLLDRSWSTRNDVVETVGSETISSVQTFRSTGAINDVRLAGSWDVSGKLHVGVGLHAITGQNRLLVQREFADTARFAALGQQSTLSYGGVALSAGAEWHPLKDAAISLSMRHGGTLRASRGDSLVSKARVPDRYGAALRYDGFAGMSLAASADWVGWSAVGDLGSARLSARDAVDFGLGLEGVGPRFAGRAMTLRGGARWRELPFAVQGSTASERSLALGFGIPLAANRAIFDVTGVRANRVNDGIPLVGGSALGLAKATENAWILSLGITVRY